MSALKKLNKGSTVMLMDQNGGQAKDVAKALTKLGFGKVLVMKGGLTGWVRAQLATKVRFPAGTAAA